MDIGRRALVAGSAGTVGLAALDLRQQVARAAAPKAPTWTTHDAAMKKFGGQRPTYWGLTAPGVRTHFPTTTAAGKDAIVLTFDACGGTKFGYDAGLIATLRKTQTPATLFINRRWAEHNPTIFKDLLADPLFDVQNHGVSHAPLSVNGRSAYGIKGTPTLSEAWYEVAACDWYMYQYWHHTPRFMRVGTAYADDVAARMVTFMGQTLVGFATNADAGASYPADTVYRETLKAKPGHIVIGHMNHPGGGTAPGMARAIPALKARGVQFRTLSQVL